MKPSATVVAVATMALIVPIQSVAQVPTAMDFARNGEVSEVSLSPDGRHIAMAVPLPDGVETQLQIIPLDGKGEVKAMRFGRQNHVTDILWSSNEQIVVARAKKEPLEEAPRSQGELMSTDTSGKNQETLFAYIENDVSRRARRSDEGRASVVKVLHDEPNKVLVDFTAWPTKLSDEKLTTVIYKVDTVSGERREIERTDETAVFQFDYSGRARMKITRDRNDHPVLMYRPGSDNAWMPVPKTLAGYSMSLSHVESDDNTAYALIIDKDEPAQLYKVDLTKGSRVRLAGRDDEEIAGIMYGGFRGAPFAVTYDESKLSVQYLDPASEWSKLHAGLMKAFPGQMVTFHNTTRDNNTLLFSTWGDRNPGSYYLLDRGAGNKLQLVKHVKPWLKESSLLPTRPISFQTRDGLTLHGLYTAPAGGGARGMVVMPHGGPHGIYDSWGYDPDAQFLASRGYGVLQVNFRGSGGRGERFEQSGYLQWGGKMQDDLADGVKWAVDNKVADPARICTYGSSYGGYAALMQTIRYPELYKCAIGYVGVYDLQVMKKEGDITYRASGNRYLDRVLGTDAAVLKAWSPAQNVDKIKVPVFLAQGSIDKRVPMDQFNALKNAFKDSAVPVETMVAQGEGHGFYKPENIAQFYTRMEAFLVKHIGPGAK
ncbi:alpha/beta hydrolase family protein [Thermomonas carbonis]|uniref:alpha/beta hydrolase family protein n=1 Tax=Thermomonas carbonis TaxID=1463158 RepID=UPI0016727036|nr:S9 family peptidase [Thermomonas carbonis]